MQVLIIHACPLVSSVGWMHMLEINVAPVNQQQAVMLSCVSCLLCRMAQPVLRNWLLQFQLCAPED
jgi:hypothetical protein